MASFSYTGKLAFVCRMKDIKGFEGKYAITRDGKVWSYPKRYNGYKGKFLSPRLNRLGYCRVYLGRGFERRVHRLVAEAYIPNPENKPHINHINNKPSDNRAENLEWCTPKENIAHMDRLGRRVISPCKGVKNGRSKLSNADIPNIRVLIAKGMGDSNIATKYNVNVGTIWFIRKGLHWTHVR